MRGMLWGIGELLKEEIYRESRIDKGRIKKYENEGENEKKWRRKGEKSMKTERETKETEQRKEGCGRINEVARGIFVD